MIHHTPNSLKPLTLPMSAEAALFDVSEEVVPAFLEFHVMA